MSVCAALVPVVVSALFASSCQDHGERAANARSAASAAAGTPTEAQRNYRLVRAPIIWISPVSDGPPALQVFLRLNRAAPPARDDSSTFALYASIGASGFESGARRIGRSRRRCYAGSIPNEYPSAELRDPQPGQRVTLRVRVGHATLSAPATLTMPRTRGARRRSLATLGCGIR
jgi:hypothetical protein